MCRKSEARGTGTQREMVSNILLRNQKEKRKLNPKGRRNVIFIYLIFD
jgi:hypothetical protein